MPLVIEQTNHCNLHCIGCPNRLNLRSKGYMVPELFKSVADEFAAHGHKGNRIALHGTGEPLLSPHFFENLDYLDKLGFRAIDFSTNGMALTEAAAREIVRHPCLAWVRISLNSSRPQLMEWINTGADFHQVVENIRGFLPIYEEAGTPFCLIIQLMQTKANSNETEADIRRVLGRGAYAVWRKKYNTFAGLVADNDLADQEWTGRARTRGFYGAEIYVHWDGDLVGCCMDTTKWQVFGNARDGIYSEPVQQRRKELADASKRRDYSELPLCRKCRGLE